VKHAQPARYETQSAFLLHLIKPVLLQPVRIFFASTIWRIFLGPVQRNYAVIPRREISEGKQV
jgi:membrane protein required for beta-lactamase induction